MSGDGKSIVSFHRREYLALAPQDSLEDRHLNIEHHDVALKAQNDDTLRVMRNVGGVNGHQLIVKDFKARLEYRKYLT